jgi:hypothetical protein
VTALLSHAGDDTTKAMLIVAQYRYRVMLAIMLPSHTSGAAVEASLPRHDIDSESC